MMVQYCVYKGMNGGIILPVQGHECMLCSSTGA